MARHHRFIRLRVLTVALLAALLGPAVAVPPAAAAPFVCSAGFECSFISGQYQIRNNYCGPAAAATVLTNWFVSGVSQQSLASRMGTDNIGFTSPLAMDDALNSIISAELAYPGFKPYTTYRSVTNAQLWDAVRYKVKYWDDVFVITVYAHKIWYPNAGTGIAHYLVVYGYSEAAGGYMVWDPAPGGGGAHHLSKNDWERVAYPGRFVVVPMWGE
ncbi:MAG: C39 family peptidase [Jiangellaceae bacterium]